MNLHLLLRSPARSLGFTILREIFAYVTIFSPTIEVVTCCLHGWCMLGVFLLPAFTSLGHECQDLLSPCDGMHVCTDWTLVYTLTGKSFEEMGSENMLTPRGKNPLHWKNSPQRRMEPTTLHQARHTTKELYE